MWIIEKLSRLFCVDKKRLLFYIETLAERQEINRKTIIKHEREIGEIMEIIYAMQDGDKEPGLSDQH